MNFTSKSKFCLREICVILPFFLTFSTAAVIDPKAEEFNNGKLTTTTPETTPNFRELALELQNNYRRMHGVGPLTLDANLSNEAQDYANTRANAKSDENDTKLIQPTHRYGMITLVKGEILDPSEIVRKATDFWYSSVSGYNWTEPLASKPTANIFSQMVWKSSLNLGIGVASSENRTVIVAFYTPPGNIQSDEEFKDNVLPALF